MKKKFVTYLRVSTQKQGRSGLGLEAQRKMCSDFIAHNHGTMVQEFVDVESGTHRDRKGLWQAIDYCKANNLPLVIAKLDRLARDVEFTFRVINTGIDIHFTDMPQVNTMILGVFAAVAQYERELISERTRKALAQKKTHGAKLGAMNEKWKETYATRSNEEKHEFGKKRGATKNARYLANKDTQAFLKILQRVFGLGDDVATWDWSKVNTKTPNRDAIRNMMIDYRDMAGCFDKWDLNVETTEQDIAFQRRLSAHYRSIKRALTYNL